MVESQPGDASPGRPEPAACSRCGATWDSADPAQILAWVAEFDQGAKRWLCPPCAREHVRDIEGKLPADFW